MLNYLTQLLRRVARMFWSVASIMVPVMVLVYVAERLGWVAWVGHALAPAMGVLGLPPEAGLVWATTIISSIYGGIAVVLAFAGEGQWTVAQMSALGSMMLFAHNMLTEQAVVRRAGGSVLLTGSLRLGVGALYGAAVAWVCRWGGWLQQPVSLGWLNRPVQPQDGPLDVWPWLLGTSRSLVMILLIIAALVLLLDALERLGITAWLTRRMAPVLRLSGLEERVAPLTTLGMLLGLVYGGALIIEATRRERYERRTLVLALCWLSLFHAVLEDTLLVVALGASVWVVLVLRGAVVLLIMMGLAAATRPHTRWGQRLAHGSPDASALASRGR